MADSLDRPAKLAALLMRHQDARYAYVMACVRNYADADDVMQNVSIAVVQSSDGPLEDGRFMAWAREIARRRVLEHQRRSRRLLPIDPTVAERLAEAADRVEREQAGATRREALLDCVEKLPVESQQLLTARYDGSADDVACLAKRFDRSEQGVYSLLYRIRNALRDCVQARLRAEGMR